MTTLKKDNFLRLAESLGWKCEATNNGKIRFSHPLKNGVVYSFKVTETPIHEYVRLEYLFFEPEIYIYGRRNGVPHFHQ